MTNAVTTWGAVAEIATFITVILGVALAWFRLRAAPKFIVGVTPTEDEVIGGEDRDQRILQGPRSARRLNRIALSELGTPNPIDEFRHAQSAFAKRIRWCMERDLLGQFPLLNVALDQIGDRKAYRGRRAWRAFDAFIDELAHDRKRRRRVRVSNNGQCQLPVVIVNAGTWAAADYKFTIAFGHAAVRILNVKSETLKVDTLYRWQPLPSQARKANVMPSHKHQEAIRAAYDGYVVIERGSDYLFLTGTLESHTYEMVVLDLLIEERIEHFGVIFRANFPLPYPGRAVFLQRVDLTWS